MTSPTVSIVIPVRDGARGLPGAVASVLAQGYQGEMEVVIAVGPSSDDTERIAAEIAGRDPRVRVVANPTGGTAAGLNAAIAATSGDVVVRCDAYAVLPPDYVAIAVATLHATGAANVGGMQVAGGHTAFERAVAIAVTGPLGTGAARYRVGGAAGPTDTVYLGVFRRDALDAVGGFDERFVRSQDAELNLRLARAGETVWFDPRLRVEYRPRGSIGALCRQYFQYGWWRRMVARLHRRSLRLRQVLPVVLLAALLASAGVALVSPVAGLIVPVAYGGVVAASTVWYLIRTRDPAAALLPVVLPAIHLSWACGFVAAQSASRPE